MGTLMHKKRRKKNKKNFFTTTKRHNNVKLTESFTSCGTLPERSTPSMPAAYDLNHSKCTVQNKTKLEYSLNLEKRKDTICN